MKTFYNILIWSAVLLGTFALLSFIGKRHEKVCCNNFQVFIDYSGGNYFLTEKDIKEIVYSSMDTIEGKHISQVNINDLEDLVESDDYVFEADAYSTIEGNVRVNVTQRDPIMRIIDRHGKSFYVDNKGRTMPLSKKFTSRVLIINGFIESSFANLADIDLSKPVSDSLPNSKMLHDAFTLGSFIQNNPFWSAMIEQVYVSANNEFELVPKLGKHVVLFGNLKDMEEKFMHLKAFYKKGIGRVGWNKYSIVNLKYKNQIICKKNKN